MLVGKICTNLKVHLHNKHKKLFEKLLSDEIILTVTEELE